jgi:hypothetical protein
MGLTQLRPLEENPSGQDNKAKTPKNVPVAFMLIQLNMVSQVVAQHWILILMWM